MVKKEKKMNKNKIGIENLVETTEAFDNLCAKIIEALEDEHLNPVEFVQAWLKIKKFGAELSDIEEMHAEIDDADADESKIIAHNLVDNLYNGYRAGQVLVPYIRDKWNYIKNLLGKKK